MVNEGPVTEARAQEIVLELLTSVGMTPGSIPDSELAFAREYLRRHEGAERAGMDPETFESRLRTVYAVLAAIRHEPTPESISLDAIDHVLGTRSLRVMSAVEQDMLGGFIFENVMVMLADPDGIHRLGAGRTDTESLDALVKTLTPMAMLKIASDPTVDGSEITHEDVIYVIEDIVPLAHADLEGAYESLVLDLSDRDLIPPVDTDQPGTVLDAVARSAGERAEALGQDSEATFENLLECAAQCRMGIHSALNAFHTLPVVEAFCEDPENDDLLDEIATLAVTFHRLSILVDDETPIAEAVPEIAASALERIDPIAVAGELDAHAVVTIVQKETMRFLMPDPDDMASLAPEPVDMLLAAVERLDPDAAMDILTGGPETPVPAGPSACTLLAAVALGTPKSASISDRLRRAVAVMGEDVAEVTAPSCVTWATRSPVETDWRKARAIARDLQACSGIDLGCAVVEIEGALHALHHDGRTTSLTAVEISTIREHMLDSFEAAMGVGDEPRCACCAGGSEAYFAEQDRMIEEHGFSYSMIAAGPGSPGFVYTIGLAEKGLPEFIFVGDAKPDVVPYLSSLVEYVRQGGTIEPGVIPPETEINGFTVPQWIIEADDKLETHAFGVRSRLERIGSDAEPRLLQVVMPDLQGRFPWQDGYQWRDQQVADAAPSRPTIH